MICSIGTNDTSSSLAWTVLSASAFARSSRRGGRPDHPGINSKESTASQKDCGDEAEEQRHLAAGFLSGLLGFFSFGSFIGHAGVPIGRLIRLQAVFNSRNTNQMLSLLTRVSATERGAQPRAPSKG